jgi:hypothetical protein
MTQFKCEVGKLHEKTEKRTESETNKLSNDMICLKVGTEKEITCVTEK